MIWCRLGERKNNGLSLKFHLGNLLVKGAIHCDKKLSKNRFKKLTDFIWKCAIFEMPGVRLK